MRPRRVDIAGLTGFLGVAIGAFWLAAGCSSVATQKGFYEPIAAELRAGNFDAAVAGIETARLKKKFKDKDRFLYLMDAGLANHYARRFDSSNTRLSGAENAADELFTKSISRAAVSLLLNDNFLEYAGEDYEVLYANIIKALNYIALDQPEDALVEIRRSDEKLSLLDRKYRDAADALNRQTAIDSSAPAIPYEAADIRFQNDALARYLGLHVYAAQGKMDDARIDHELMLKAFADQPNIYPFPPPPVIYRSENNAVLSAVAMVGLSPVKEALNLRLRTDKDLDLVQIIYDSPDSTGPQYGQFALPISEDYYFKLSIPQIVPRPSIIEAVRITASDGTSGTLYLLEDIGRVAQETFEAKRTMIYIKTVMRALAKGLTTHKAKEKADDGKAGGWLKKLAMDIAADISENADLRCSRLLPGRVFVGDFEIAPGTYDLRYEFLDPAGAVVRTQTITGYTVLKNGLNLIEAASFD